VARQFQAQPNIHRGQQVTIFVRRKIAMDYNSQAAVLLYFQPKTFKSREIK